MNKKVLRILEMQYLLDASLGTATKGGIPGEKGVINRSWESAAEADSKAMAKIQVQIMN